MLLGLVRLFIIKISELPEEYHISHCMLRYFQNGNRIALLHLYCIFNIASYRIIEGIDCPLMLMNVADEWCWWIMLMNEGASSPVGLVRFIILLFLLQNIHFAPYRDATPFRCQVLGFISEPSIAYSVSTRPRHSVLAGLSGTVPSNLLTTS